GPLHGAQHIGAVAGAADRDEQVAGTRQILQLLHKHTLKSFVVAPGENVRRVVGQTEDAQPSHTVAIKILATQRPLAEIFTEMRRIRTAAAVATKKNEPLLHIAVVNGVGQRLDLGRVEAEKFLAD